MKFCIRENVELQQLEKTLPHRHKSVRISNKRLVKIPSSSSSRGLECLTSDSGKHIALRKVRMSVLKNFEAEVCVCEFSFRCLKQTFIYLLLV